MTVRIIAGAALGLVLSTAAFAQTYTAPAGIPAATAPGGLEGRAAAGNLEAYAAGRPGQVSVEGVYTTGTIRQAPADHGRYAR